MATHLPDAGPLFGSKLDEKLDEEDVVAGTIYVLRSHSNHPFVSKHRALIHKIGVTGGKVESRIGDASRESTYLLADVKVIAKHIVANVSDRKLEALMHRVFAPAKIALSSDDRFGTPEKPREWFLVPLHVIDAALMRIRDGSITA